MKTSYIIGGAALLLLWVKGMHRTSARDQLLDSEPLAGGDFVGDTWARLDGADLVAQGYPNITNSPNADPGRIGVMGLNLNTMWNGTIR